VCCYAGGLAPPVADWKEKLDQMNQEIRKLEDEYQTICIQQKVCVLPYFVTLMSTYHETSKN